MANKQYSFTKLLWGCICTQKNVKSNKNKKSAERHYKKPAKSIKLTKYKKGHKQTSKPSQIFGFRQKYIVFSFTALNDCFKYNCEPSVIVNGYTF